MSTAIDSWPGIIKTSHKDRFKLNGFFMLVIVVTSFDISLMSSLPRVMLVCSLLTIGLNLMPYKNSDYCDFAGGDVMAILTV